MVSVSVCVTKILKCLSDSADAEKMNNSVLNIKDEGIAQQLFLFIFH